MNYTEKAIEILDKFEQYTKGSLRDSGINNIMPLLKEALREKLEREKNPPLTLSEITSEQFNMFTGCVFLETPYELRNYGVT